MREYEQPIPVTGTKGSSVFAIVRQAAFVQNAVRATGTYAESMTADVENLPADILDPSSFNCVFP